MRLAALIVTWNRLAALQQSLPRMLAEAVDRVLVVDNASDDGTADWLATLADPRLSVLRLAENGGGAGGFAAGMAALTQGEDPPDWICLLDDDAWPAPGTMAAFRARNGGAEGPLAVAAAVDLPDGRLAEMNRPARNPFWNLPALLRGLTGRGRDGFHLSDADCAPGAPVIAIDTASFVGLFVARDAVARAGLPDARLFIYGDDVTYCLRLRRAGGTIRFDPALRFVHDCGTLGAGLETRPLWKVYYLCRNGVLMARLAAGRLLFPLALGWYLLAWARKARHYDTRERPAYWRLMRMGVRDGLTRRLGRNAQAHAIGALAETPPNR